MKWIVNQLTELIPVNANRTGINIRVDEHMDVCRPKELSREFRKIGENEYMLVHDPALDGKTSGSPWGDETVERLMEDFYKRQRRQDDQTPSTTDIGLDPTGKLGDDGFLDALAAQRYGRGYGPRLNDEDDDEGSNQYMLA